MALKRLAVVSCHEAPHHFFLAECGRCGFAVEGEMRNGYGGWKEYDCNAFSRSCTHRTPQGRPTMVCPHLRAAKLAAQPLTSADFLARMHACAPLVSRAEEPELAAAS